MHSVKNGCQNFDIKFFERLETTARIFGFKKADVANNNLEFE